MLAVALLLVSGCSVEILHDLDEPQANTVLATLQKHGVTADKQRVASGSKATYTVAVPRGDAPRAWQLLRQHNLPRAKQAGLGEVFGAKQSLVPSSAEQRALLRHALAGEITRTLQSVHGVREARVHVVLPRRDPLASPDSPKPRPRAAVLLKVAGAPSISKDDIRKLVAGGVEGLAKKDVEVVIATSKAANETAAPAAVATASVGPFQVAAGSRGGLLATLIIGVLLILLLALALLVFALRFRALKRLRAEETSAGRARSADIESSLSLLGRSFDKSR
jgi:type III secretion protein J